MPKRKVNLNSDDVFRAEARKAAIEYLQKIASDWQAKGLQTQLYETNVFWVTADIERNTQSAVVRLIVRRFIPENGEPYWRAGAMDRSVQDKITTFESQD